jgi:thiol-disulfide isomerase/thioredoxin
MREIVYRVLCASLVAGAICACGSMTFAAIEEPTATQGGPVCEESASTRQALHNLRDDVLLTQAVVQERRQAVYKLIEQYPDNVFFHLDYLLNGDRGGDDKTATIARYKKLLDEHPGNSMYPFLYAVALIDRETPEAFSRLKSIPDNDPFAPLSHAQLGELYEWGKFANREEARKQAIAFYDACPGSLEWRGRRLLHEAATPEMAAKYEFQLRNRLKDETDLTLLPAWKTVWDLEFVMVPIAQQDALRMRLQKEVSQLRDQIHSDDPAWLSVLKSGFHRAGDTNAEREIADQIVTKYPESDESQRILSERWESEHPRLKEDASKQSTQDYHRAVLARANSELKKRPGDNEAQNDRFNALIMLDGTSNDDVVTAGEAFRSALRVDTGWYSSPPAQLGIAKIYLERKVRADEIPALVAEANEADTERRSTIDSDRMPDEVTKNRAVMRVYMILRTTDLLVEAATQLRNPEIARAAVEELSQQKIDMPFMETEIWKIKAKWAELNGHKLDALLMYRASLDARRPGFKIRGKEIDQSKEGYARLWKELGGTDDGRQAWLTAVAGAKVAAEGGWTKASKDLPAWELSDLNGKLWKLSELKGKTVLINVWATWCGPCRQEHPYLQALYEKMKDRKDIQILTFDIDDSVGDVAPYMKDNKYTFPVLIARDLIYELMPVPSVPQNWIVDSANKWRWSAEGFGDGDEWRKRVIEKLEGEKTPK